MRHLQWRENFFLKEIGPALIAYFRNNFTSGQKCRIGITPAAAKAVQWFYPAKFFTYFCNGEVRIEIHKIALKGFKTQTMAKQVAYIGLFGNPGIVQFKIR